MATPPHITVVLITYNAGAMLDGALSSMVNQESGGEFTFDILVVDDRSTDGTFEAAQRIAAEAPVAVTCIQGEGRGVSSARNRGFAAAQGDFVAFFDQDQTADPQWLGELYRVAAANGAHVVDGPRDLLLPRETIERLAPPFRAHLGEIPGGGAPRRITGRTASCTGNQLIRRRVIEAVGGFDERMLRGGEDWDYFRRVRRAGFSLWFAPGAVVHHVIPPERLRVGFFTWRSLRNGQSFAYRDCMEWGLAKTCASCLARLGLSASVHAPRFLWARLRGHAQTALAWKCMMLRTTGYALRTLTLIAPALLPEERVFARLELRREREATTALERNVTDLA